MPGRLQKVAAFIAAAWAFAAPAFAADPDGLSRFDVGFQRRLPLGIETTVSMFRARPEEIVLPFENAITEFSRPTSLQGVQAAARYEPAPWLTVDLSATAARARFTDRAAELVPGAAERFASAMATAQGPAGWSAGLGVSYVAKRAGVDEPASLAASTFFNARLARELSPGTGISLDFANLLGQKLTGADYFSASRLPASPAEPRGVRLQFHTTF